MFVRLIWKETRLFLPMWVAIGSMAGAVQAMLLWLGGAEFRHGELTALALGWATLYGLVAGAAAFAGERETKTLLFLDGLGIDRRVLWSSKAVFLFASTLALGAVLAGLAELSAARAGPSPWDAAPLRIIPVVLVALTISLFWSSLLQSALNAAVLTVLSAGGLALLLIHDLDRQIGSVRYGAPPTSQLLLEAGLAILAVAVSWRQVTRGPGQGHRVRAGASADQLSATRSLLWLTWRDARATWAVLLGLLALLVFPFSAGDPQQPKWAAVILCLLSPAVGVFVFASETRHRSYRLAAAHGVSPGVFWLVRQAGWITFLIGFMLMVALGLSSAQRSSAGSGELYLVLVILAYGYAVGQICGMVVPRSVTAWGLALPFTVALLIVHGLPAMLLLAPIWTMALPVLLLLGVSLFWCADWMYERPAPGRWVRLSAALIVPYVLLFLGFIGYRAWSVPRLEPPLERPAATAGSPEALEVSRAYLEILTQVGEKLFDGSPPSNLSSPLTSLAQPAAAEQVGERSRVEQIGPFAERVRQLVNKPIAFPGAERETIFSAPNGRMAEIRGVADLMTADFRGRLAHGDLRPAWQDVMALYRLGHQLDASPQSMIQALEAVSMHERASQLAIVWAGDSRQKPELLRSALGDAWRIGALPTLRNALLAEVARMDRTLSLPAASLRNQLSEADDRGLRAPMIRLVTSALLLAPWERERARRVTELLTAELIQQADSKACARPRPSSLADGTITDLEWPSGTPKTYVSGSRLLHYWLTTPAVRMFGPDERASLTAWDRHLVVYRASLLVMALRTWQLEHGEIYPESLTALVPGVIPVLPSDPYSCAPFGYVRAHGQPAPAPEHYGDLHPGLLAPLILTKPGQPLLYSVGPDRKDDQGEWKPEFGTGDILIPLPVTYERDGPDQK